MFADIFRNASPRVKDWKGLARRRRAGAKRSPEKPGPPDGGNAQIICTKVFQIGAVWGINMRKYRYFLVKNGVKIAKKWSFLGVFWLKMGILGLK
jgi:hypothetical protein